MEDQKIPIEFLPVDAIPLADVVYALLEKKGMKFSLYTNEELAELREACNKSIKKIEEVAPKNKSILFFCTIRSNIATIVMDRFVF